MSQKPLVTHRSTIAAVIIMASFVSVSMFADIYFRVSEYVANGQQGLILFYLIRVVCVMVMVFTIGRIYERIA